MRVDQCSPRKFIAKACSGEVVTFTLGRGPPEASARTGSALAVSSRRAELARLEPGRWILSSEVGVQMRR